jgi:hypothetical protein
VNGQPRREDFPTHDAYLLAWYTWRAVQRDGRLTDEEMAAAYAVKEARVRNLFAERTV